MMNNINIVLDNSGDLGREIVEAVRCRKLATVRRIAKIEPIEGADKIVKATVDGWSLVTAIDNGFKEGDLVCYLEIDSWVPTEVAPFLSKGKEPREFNGVKGERLKTIKLRGQVSQGLLLPIEYESAQFAGGGFYKIGGAEWIVCSAIDVNNQLQEGIDLTEYLKVQKWEKPIPAQLAGQCRGNFPSFIRKTDQDRAQNLLREISEAFFNDEGFEVTEKIDGSSMTVYYNEYEPDNNGPIDIKYGVCSRNLDLKLDQEGNAFVDKANSTGLIEALIKYRRNIAVQGELYGEGIQGNNEGITGTRFAVFDIFDIDAYEYLKPDERMWVLSDLRGLGANIQHVPIIADAIKLPTNDVSVLLKIAEAKNSAGNEREGLVWKSHSRSFSFKTISNAFLLGGGD